MGGSYAADPYRLLGRFVVARDVFPPRFLFVREAPLRDAPLRDAPARDDRLALEAVARFF